MEDNFFPTVDVWIRKPHTLHSKIFGAKLQLVGGIVYGRTIIPKLSTKIGKFYESVEHNNSVIKFRSDFLEYVIRLDDAKISARVLDISSTELFDTGWIEKVLPEKLNRLFSQTLHPSPASLELVDIDVYQTLYTHLKCKYSKLLVENWCEKTDAFKFVFEDIGIAAYLMCIWKDPSDVFFVDIGCGNGLLVYLLISEGFRGLGVDIRHRRIWDSYPASVRESLKESTLDAEHNPGFPQANWLIGNHSDELTPWIPVLAARTSHSCKVFVIPCCPFGLFGKYGNFKHSDTQSGISSTDAWVKSEVHKQSHYRAYIEYLKGLFFACWFKPEVDTLRIPSTKRDI
ncbi:unnamed protein product [Calicophoron daubneyi]|uniref:tRNA (uracil-O(2)-)-methyltransferase n=1 Tax=Calicophoron daubneyi TaxID=300641 RepID=A0AAV2TFV1_CALDB